MEFNIYICKREQATVVKLRLGFLTPNISMLIFVARTLPFLHIPKMT
jgi:hypothetical protein